jgi:hypothetical protein
MKQIIKEVILENQELNIDNIIERENINIPLNTGLITTIIGSRRSGKTYLLYYLMQQLKKTGVPKEQIIFFNFEDERINFSGNNLDLIIQAYQEIYPKNKLSECYLFFDEVQNVNQWEKFIRRLFDFKTKNIFITGSNAKFLSAEIATELRGRTVTFTVYPFSYKEFLNSFHVPVNMNTQANRAMMINMAEKFLYEGGFPELVNLDKSLKIKVLQQYFNVMIYRDIVERFTISNPEVLKYFIKKIFASVTVPLSVNKIYNDLKSMGYKISNKYLYEYMEHCNDIFLTRNIARFNFSTIKQAKSDKKVYVVDNGLLSAIDFQVSDNRGKLLENMVVMEFLKHNKEILYYRDNYECDIILKEETDFQAIQIAWSIKENDTRLREIRGLQHACKALGKKQGTIITFDEEEKIEFDSFTINVAPFYKYFSN